jgi:hypothetical protein
MKHMQNVTRRHCRICERAFADPKKELDDVGAGPLGLKHQSALANIITRVGIAYRQEELDGFGMAFIGGENQGGPAT